MNRFSFSSVFSFFCVFTPLLLAIAAPFTGPAWLSLTVEKSLLVSLVLVMIFVVALMEVEHLNDPAPY